MKTRALLAAALGAAFCVVTSAGAADLEAGFKAPPHEAKPHTWFHMMNGNVTKAGLTRDFEALAKAGIGGVQMFDAGCAIPPGGLDFNSPEWFDMFRYAASEARRLGLEICIPNCSGWSSSGGPWNPPSNGMKRVTFTLTKVTGPKKVALKLPREKKDNGFYADIGVFAFPTPAAEKVSFADVKTTVAADGKSFTLAGDRPFTAAGFSYALDYPWAWSADTTIALEVSDDGATFRPLEKFLAMLGRSGANDHGVRYHAFPQKLTMKALRGKILQSPVKTTFRNPRLEATVKLSSLFAKTFGIRQETEPDATPTTPDQVVAKGAVRDVTANMAADGSFAWDAPAGDWTILRVGYACTGSRNHPASKFGVGLEVDKLSAEALDYHFEQYVGRLCRTLGSLAGAVETGFNNILVDSYEVGSQNWTQKMEGEFQKRRGYSLRPYLPAFAGFVIDDVPTTERFLEDFRRVVSDLFAENYAGALAKKCHQYGLKCSIEPYGNGPSDNLQYGQYCDIPMGEFWSHASNPYSGGSGNAKFVSSVAHVWGKPFVGTESFTATPSAGSGRWMTTPFSIKAQGDEAFARGVNRIIYHRFTHQPWPNDKYLPGMTMGRWGMHLDRTQTWWDYASPWFAYQARCQYLLQQGTFCADVLYFAGEEAPNQGGNTDGGAAVGAFYKLPAGYTSDTCPTDAMYLLTVDAEGRVVVPGGVRYRVLAIPPVEAMSPEMVAAIAKLRAAGATVAWMKKPVRAPGLKWGKDGDAKVRALADALWAKGVFTGSPAEALKMLGVTPDLTLERNPAGNNAAFSWIHRGDATADWYFVALPNHDETTVTVSFRQTGRVPELWDAETGVCAPADVWDVKDGRTVVEIPLSVCGSKFVVFRRAVDAAVPHIASCAVKATRRADPMPVDAVKHTLVIREAKYGVRQARKDGQDHFVDVTAKLAGMVKNGTLSLAKVDNGIAGRDPLFGEFKRLYVTYVYDGKEQKATVNEGSAFAVPTQALAGLPTPDATWRDGALYAWQPLTATLAQSDGTTRTLTADPPAAVPVACPWKVRFPHGYLPNKLAQGADEEVVFDSLGSWSESENLGVRYFSGTATYLKTVPAADVAKVWQEDGRVVLDLGMVKHFAEVTANGRLLATLWKPPFRVDVTDVLKAGEPLELKIRVTNLWANRLIGDDRQFADDCEWQGKVVNGVKEIGVKAIPQWVKDGKKSPTGRCTFTTWKHWDKNDELLPSGILGPVCLRAVVPAK